MSVNGNRATICATLTTEQVDWSFDDFGQWYSGVNFAVFIEDNG